jgi:type IV pilus assembly protein PilA
LLSQVNKGKQAEAKQNVGSLNRSQQAYFLEAGQFASTVADLGVGIKSQTVNYFYTIKSGPGAEAVNNIGASNQSNVGAGKKQTTLRSYVGQNFTSVGDKTTSEVLTLGFVCETNDIGVTGSQKATTTGLATNASTACPSGFKDLGSGTTKK